jgi:hypothetical protein
MSFTVTTRLQARHGAPPERRRLSPPAWPHPTETSPANPTTTSAVRGEASLVRPHPAPVRVWLTSRPAHLDGHPYERILRQFATWHHLAKLRTKATNRPLTNNALTYASMEIKRAIEFCTWLDQQAIPLADVPQAALDRYYTTLTQAHQQALCGFLNWTMRTKRMPRLTVTRRRFRIGDALTQHDWLALLRNILHAEDQPLAARVAGCLMLLYAQPIPWHSSYHPSMGEKQIRARVKGHRDLPRGGRETCPVAVIRCARWWP